MSFVSQPQLSYFQNNGPQFIKAFNEDPTLGGVLLRHQHKALSFALDWFQAEDTLSHPCVVVMPTGTGKTGVMILLAFLLQCHRYMVIVPSTQLQQQISIAFRGDPDHDKKAGASSFMCRRGLLDCCPLQLLDRTPGGSYDEFRRYDVFVSTAQAFHLRDKNAGRKWATSLPWDEISVLVIDEAHHYPADLWLILVNTAKQHRVRILFLTATPYRTDGQLVIDVAAMKKDLGTRKLFFQYRRKKAIEDNIIRETQLAIGPEPDRMGTFLLEHLRKKDEEHPLPNEQPHRAIVVAKDRDQGKELKKAWNAEDVGALFYHSDKTERRRKRVLDRFHDQESGHRILIVVECLREGYDFPACSVVAFCNKVKSPVKLDQFIGRGVRVIRSPDGPEVGIKCDVFIPPNEPKMIPLYDNVINGHLIPQDPNEHEDQTTPPVNEVENRIQMVYHDVINGGLTPQDLNEHEDETTSPVNEVENRVQKRKWNNRLKKIRLLRMKKNKIIERGRALGRKYKSTLVKKHY